MNEPVFEIPCCCFSSKCSQKLCVRAWRGEGLCIQFEGDVPSGERPTLWLSYRCLPTILKPLIDMLVEKTNPLHDPSPEDAARDRADLIRACQALLEFWDNGSPVHPGAEVVADLRAAVVRVGAGKEVTA